MTFRKTYLGLLIAITFSVSIVVLAPATLIAFLLKKASGDVLQLNHPTGTFWKGRGDLLALSNGQTYPIGVFHWQVHPTSTSASAHFDDRSSFTIKLHSISQKLDVSNLNLTLPVASLSALIPAINKYQLLGDADITSEQITIQGSNIQGTANVRWNNASSGMSSVRPLGDYLIEADFNGDATSVKLSTITGKLTLAGSGVFDVAHGFHFNGSASTNSPDENMIGLLNVLGQESSPGIYGIKL